MRLNLASRLNSPAHDGRMEDVHTGLSLETLERDWLDNLFFIQGVFPEIATQQDLYLALAYTVRDRLLHRWINTQETYLKQKDTKIVGYLSAEFLPGPQLGNNLLNLGLYDDVRQMVEAAGLDLEAMLQEEAEPGLGNGGLGRLAACFLDSLATLEIPTIGYGIRYEFGIFDQAIQDGYQVELTDKWLLQGNPWEIPRPASAVDVKFGGYTRADTDEQGRYRVRWVPHQVVRGIPYNMPIMGYRVNTANTLRLWRAEAHESFDFRAFNQGDYYGAVHEKVVSENMRILPAADLSEQISTAGYEASGTSNMKFALNGALTIGTLDGANVEIRDAVGAENFFLFGLTAEQVLAQKAAGYRPRTLYERDPELRAAIDLINSGHFSHGDADLFKPLVDGLLNQDPFMLLADYSSYVTCQDQVGQVYGERDRWTPMAILNTARIGRFSSDRAIREYCQQIWQVQSVKVDLAAGYIHPGPVQLPPSRSGD